MSLFRGKVCVGRMAYTQIGRRLDFEARAEKWSGDITRVLDLPDYLPCSVPMFNLITSSPL
jgi:hypothetical protein